MWSERMVDDGGLVAQTKIWRLQNYHRRSHGILLSGLLRAQRGLNDAEAKLINRRNCFLEDTRVELTKAEDDLMVEAKVSPTDIACVRPVLDATIRFGPFDYTIYGGDKRGDLR